MNLLRGALPYVLMLVVGVAVLALSSAGHALARSESAATHQGLRVFFTGDTRGYLEPCGCVAGQFGGLPRRATFLAQRREADDLLIDLGNIIQGTRPHDQLRMEYVLRGLAELQYDALVPGEGELAFGEDFERAISAVSRPKVICANLVRADTRMLVFAPSATWTLRDGSRIAFVGLTSPYQSVPSRYAVDEPAAALRREIESLKNRGVETVLVGGFLKGQPALNLAQAFPAVTVIAGAFVPRGSDSLLQRGGAPVMLGGERGQYVFSVQLDSALRATQGRRDWLGEDVPDAPALRELVTEHDREVSELGAAFARETLAGFKREGWLGSQSCKECHEAEYRAWRASKHSHAMDALRERHQDKNPNCMTCHLRDLTSADDSSANVAGIGCESCHGGGAEHAESARNVKVPLRTPLAAQNNACTACHDRANSANFEVEDYWGKIRHGLSKEKRR